VDFYILYAEWPLAAIFLLPVCLTYCLESIPHASTPTSIIPTKFEVDITIHCRVIAFLSADRPTSCDLVTLTFDHLTFNSYRICQVTWPTLPPSLKTLWLFVLESRVITFPIDYHAYAFTVHAPNHVTREYGVKNNYIFGIPDPNLPIHYATSVALRWK